jgi:GMP reductase
MRIEEDIKLDYKDVLIRPKRSTLQSRKQVRLNRKFQFRNYKPGHPDHAIHEHYIGIPIMAANMDGVGTMRMADKLAEGEMFTCLVKTYSAEELIVYFNGEDLDGNGLERTENVAMSIGTGDSDYNKLIQVKKECDYRLKYVCMDIANGYSDHFAAHVRRVRAEFPDLVIIAGNVVTREMTEELILAGADIVKVGIGPGSVCTTRIQTGVGYPQLSAVIECADAAHGLGGHIIADGGCTCPGDVAKAFAAGADFVMLGGMLAGHNEGGGDVIEKYYKTGEWVKEETTVDKILRTTWKDGIERKQFVQFYGMSSESANDKHFGGLKNYRSSEGRTVLVPYRGEVARTVQEILGGVRSTCTYAGAMKLKQLAKCTTFIRCTQTHNPVYEGSTIGK